MSVDPLRPLQGCIAGISISDSEGDMERNGFDRSDMNRCVVRLSEMLLADGARIAFGHDWRPGGVMMAVAALAVRHFPFVDGDQPKGPAPILNLVAPPAVPFLSAAADSSADPIVGRLKGIVDARPVEVPSGTSPAEALSIMRTELTELCDIRICLGGKLRGYSGVMPGVVEEALGALRKGRPVFASAIFGGASAFIADQMRQAASASPAPPDGKLHEQAAEIREHAPKVPNGLTPSEQESLWGATSIDQCIELILRGATKLFSDRSRSSTK
jgi:hypothetical protein